MIKKIKINNKTIFLPPIEEVISKIKNEQDNIFLVGAPGSGKSTVLDMYEKVEHLETPIIDCTVGLGQYVFIPDNEVYNLYHTCLVIQKILLHIKNNYPIIYDRIFPFYTSFIDRMLEKITQLYVCSDYENKYEYLGKEYCQNPEILFDSFIDMALRYLGYENFTIVIDEFDSMGSSSFNYQTFIYKLLARRLKVIATVSDLDVVTSDERKEELSKLGTIIPVDYSLNLEAASEILDIDILERGILKGNELFFKRLRVLLSDDILAKLIKETNGNLIEMQIALSDFYLNLPKLNKEDYENYILNYVKYAEFIRGIAYPSQRTLHLK